MWVGISLKNTGGILCNEFITGSCVVQWMCTSECYIFQYWFTSYNNVKTLIIGYDKSNIDQHIRKSNTYKKNEI